MPQPRAEHALDHLAAQIHDRVRHRPGRLSWLRVCAPPAQRDEVAAHLESLLADMGLDFVDVAIDAREGRPEIIEARFDRGWA